jgi:hypothetical protein
MAGPQPIYNIGPETITSLTVTRMPKLLSVFWKSEFTGLTAGTNYWGRV